MYYVGDRVKFPVPEADDCWECFWYMSRFHGGKCPGLRINGTKIYSPNAEREMNQ